MTLLRGNAHDLISTISMPSPQRQHPETAAGDWAYHLGCTCPPCNRDGGSGSWIPGRGYVGEEVSTTTIIECQDQIATSFTVPVDQTTPTKMTPSEAPAAPEFTVQLQSEAREEQAVDRNGEIKLPPLDRLRMNAARRTQHMAKFLRLPTAGAGGSRARIAERASRRLLPRLEARRVTKMSRL